MEGAPKKRRLECISMEGASKKRRLGRISRKGASKRKRLEYIVQRFFFHLNPRHTAVNNVNMWIYLTDINLSNSLITDLPRAFGDLAFIKELNLSYNYLAIKSNESGNEVDWPWIRQTGIKRTLENMDLSNNSLTKLPTALGDLACLVKLNLSYNSLGTCNQTDWPWIRQTAIKSSLEDLDLSNNFLTELPTALGDLACLLELNLSYNSLGTCNQTNWPWIRQTAIKSSLENLDLSNNLLTKLPTALGDLACLVELNLSYNCLGTCNQTDWPWIRQTAIKSSLADLDLSNNLLTKLPTALGDLACLVEINLSYNSLGTCNQTDWPWIRQTAIKSSLVDLDLSNNSLTELPTALGDLPRLLQLNLSHNCLGLCNKIKWTWIRQTAIKNTLMLLNLSYNSLTELPPYIGRLIALVELNVSHNMLKCLPQTIANIPALDELDVSYNRLLYLNQELLYLDNLTSLDISMNPFPAQESVVSRVTDRPPTLVELSAKTVLNKRIPYEHLPDSVIDSVDMLERCCDCKVTGIIYVKDVYTKTDSNVNRIINTTLDKPPIIEGYYCYECGFKHRIIGREYHDYLRNLQR